MAKRNKPLAAKGAKLASGFRFRDERRGLGGLLFLTIAAIAFWWLPENIGSVTEMGPGYFPMLLAICLAILGTISVISGIVAKNRVTIGQFPWLPLLFLILGVVAFALLIDGVGLALALLALVLASCYGRLLKRPFEVAVIYLVLLGMTWLLFVHFIRIPIALL